MIKTFWDVKDYKDKHFRKILTKFTFYSVTFIQNILLIGPSVPIVDIYK